LRGTFEEKQADLSVKESLRMNVEPEWRGSSGFEHMEENVCSCGLFETTAEQR
jgi:hypothetical protein